MFHSAGKKLSLKFNLLNQQQFGGIPTSVFICFCFFLVLFCKGWGGGGANFKTVNTRTSNPSLSLRVERPLSLKMLLRYSPREACMSKNC